ncbi:MAG TPA: hypothetical protein PKA13_01560 [Geminicoccaceae bacterium]|nr:hypothetical protein [Geminicoccus sp.]HMU48428.1 hypothetical protein [Geminicoccaceae bacterium]
MQDKAIDNSELARVAVLTRLRQRHERLRQLARIVDRGLGEQRPPRPEQAFVANSASLLAPLALPHAGDA